jgi:hypothetical protein
VGVDERQRRGGTPRLSLEKYVAIASEGRSWNHSTKNGECGGGLLRLIDLRGESAEFGGSAGGVFAGCATYRPG